MEKSISDYTLLEKYLGNQCSNYQAYLKYFIVAIVLQQFVEMNKS